MQSLMIIFSDLSLVSLSLVYVGIILGQFVCEEYANSVTCCGWIGMIIDVHSTDWLASGKEYIITLVKLTIHALVNYV